MVDSAGVVEQFDHKLNETLELLTDSMATEWSVSHSLSCVLLIVLTLQIQSGKCCALGEFLTKLWSAMQVHYALLGLCL